MSTRKSKHNDNTYSQVNASVAPMSNHGSQVNHTLQLSSIFLTPCPREKTRLAVESLCDYRTRK